MDSDSGSGYEDNTIDPNNFNISTVFDEVTQRLDELDRRIVEQYHAVQEPNSTASCPIADRTNKLRNWRNELKIMHNRIERELYELRQEKLATEKLVQTFATIHKSLIDFPAIPVHAHMDANNYIDIQIEFGKELEMLGRKQEVLVAKCLKAEAFLKRLEELKVKVDDDVADKDAGPDPINAKKYAKWVKMTEDYKKTVQAAITDGNFMGLSLFAARDEAGRDVKAQRQLSLSTMNHLVNTTHLTCMSVMSKALCAKVEAGQRTVELLKLQEELRLKTNRQEFCRNQLDDQNLNSLLLELRTLEQEKAVLGQRIRDTQHTIDDLTAQAEAYDQVRLSLEKSVNLYKQAISSRKQLTRMVV